MILQVVSLAQVFKNKLLVVEGVDPARLLEHFWWLMNSALRGCGGGGAYSKGQTGILETKQHV